MRLFSTRYLLVESAGDFIGTKSRQKIYQSEFPPRLPVKISIAYIRFNGGNRKQITYT
jgi:hypothetical protein